MILILYGVTCLMWFFLQRKASLVAQEEKNMIGAIFTAISCGAVLYLIYLGILDLFRSNYEPIGLAISSSAINIWILTSKTFSTPAIYPSANYLNGAQTTADLVIDKKKCREAIHRIIRRKTTGLFRGVKEETTDFEAAITDACEKHLNSLYDGTKQQTAEKCASVILLLSALATLGERSAAAGFGSEENSPSDKKILAFAKEYLNLCDKKRYINDGDRETGEKMIAFFENQIETSEGGIKRRKQEERTVAIVLLSLFAVVIIGGAAASFSRNSAEQANGFIVPQEKEAQMIAFLYAIPIWNDGVGDSWSAAFSINGEKLENVESDGEYLSCFWGGSMEAGDEVIFDSLITEDDTLPDEGMERTSYKVRAKDLVSGFTIVQHIAVEENNGQYYSNKTATWIVLCMFFPSDRLGDIAIRFGT